MDMFFGCKILADPQEVKAKDWFFFDPAGWKIFLIGVCNLVASTVDPFSLIERRRGTLGITCARRVIYDRWRTMYEMSMNCEQFDKASAFLGRFPRFSHAHEVWPCLSQNTPNANIVTTAERTHL